MKTTAAMCSEKEVLWNKCVYKTLIKITGDTAFLKTNSYTMFLKKSDQSFNWLLL